MRRARGFGLIELMVVVATIGLLVSIALPKLQKHVRRAKQAQRSTQTRLIEDAARRYFDENGKWPTVDNASSKLSSSWNPVALTSSSTFDPSATEWKMLQVPLEGVSRFQYQLTGSAIRDAVSLVVVSRADLDGNGTYAVVTRTWTLTGTQWNVSEVVSGDLLE
jgi:prepilin-type N-terminal cleavage/methylation domain-containing protein